VASHILRNTRAVLDVKFSAGDATGTVTYTVKDDAGAVLATGNAQHDASVPVVVGRYFVALDPQAELGILRVDWTGTFDGASQTITTWAEVVGSRLFTIAELRAMDDLIADEDAFPDWKIAVARDRIEDWFRDTTGVSFTRRRKRHVCRGYASPALDIPDKNPLRVVSASIDGSALGSTELDALELRKFGQIRRAGSWGSGSTWGPSSAVVVTYEYGYDDPPAQIRYAAMMLARREVVTVDVDDRAVTLSNELGTIRLAVPGPGFNRTGIPVVDQALNDYEAEDVFV